MPRPRTTRVNSLLPTVVLLAIAGCSTSEAPFLDARSGDVEICHIPPDNPAAAHTIFVGPNAAAEHIQDHGDYLGACKTACELTCEDIGAEVGEFCLAAPPLPEPVDCDAAEALVEAECVASCPEPSPEECVDFCTGLRSDVLAACFEELPLPPPICEIGADFTYQTCLDAFACPPPPPTCFDECFFALDEALLACDESMADPECHHAAHLEAEVCLQGCCVDDCNVSCEQNCPDATCVGDCQAGCEMQCVPPPPPPPTCYDECFFVFDQALQACFEAGGDPLACHLEADAELQACNAGCCTAECGSMCEQGCMGDPLCLEMCVSDCPLQCDPNPPPPPPPPPPPGDPMCWDACFFAFDQAMSMCDAQGGDPICLDQAHLELMACEAGCCVHDCNAWCESDCMGDPICLMDCQGQCPLQCGV